MNESNPTPDKSVAETKQKHFLLWFFSWFIRRPGMQLLFIIIAILLPALTLVYFVVLPTLRFIPLPVSATKEIQNDSVHGQKTTTVAVDLPTILKIHHKEQQLNFLQNRLHLARQDSIYLVLNLNDSLLDIEIKGLDVHRCKLHGIEVTNRLKVATHHDMLNWLNKPFTLRYELATIPKVPILVVDAPKDTTEAAKLPKKPLEPEKTAVFLTLMFDRGLVVQIEQVEEVPEEELTLVQHYEQQLDSLFGRSFLQKIIQPMPADLPVMIKLRMNEADARSIYRSIPHIGAAQLILAPLDKTH